MENANRNDGSIDIKVSITLVVGAALTAVIAYALWFGWRQGLPLASSPASWGEFGDFVGGVSNPVIAFMALYWLTQTVLLQRRELGETKAALQKAADAQTKQVRIAGLTALVTVHDSKREHTRRSIERFDARKAAILKNPANYDDASGQIKKLNADTVVLVKRLDELSFNIERLQEHLEALLVEPASDPNALRAI